jgi:hypothetical protein
LLDIFPCFKTREPLIFDITPYNFNFIKPPNKVFRSAPYVENEAYIDWLDRVEKEFGEFWKSHGIFDLIQISRIGPKYHTEMLVAALHFYENSTNTFHFECGMMTPTLFDVAAITGLRPIGETYDPTQTSNNISFIPRESTFQKYITENRGVTDSEVSDIEHVAFLTLWLSHYIFCSSSLQVAKKFIPMAIQIHEGQQFGLGKLILASLYESIGTACDSLKKVHDGSTFLAAGPFWLLQLWLNATFEKEMELIVPKDYVAFVNQRQIEGIRAARLTPLPKGLKYEQLFMKYFNVFFHLSTFKREHAPFVDRKVGHTWFIEEFPTTNVDNEDDITKFWSAFLDPAILSCRIGKDAKSYGLVGYHPNLVSRQFGFSQIVPKSFYLRVKDVCLGYCGISEKRFKAFLKLSEDNKYEIHPFPYTISYYCSKGFADWWERYYTSRTVEKNSLLSRLEIGFRQPQIEKIRSKRKTLGINYLTSLSLNQL